MGLKAYKYRVEIVDNRPDRVSHFLERSLLGIKAFCRHCFQYFIGSNLGIYCSSNRLTFCPHDRSKHVETIGLRSIGFFQLQLRWRGLLVRDTSWGSKWGKGTVNWVNDSLEGFQGLISSDIYQEAIESEKPPNLCSGNLACRDFCRRSTLIVLPLDGSICEGLHSVRSFDTIADWLHLDRELLWWKPLERLLNVKSRNSMRLQGPLIRKR